jgi:hypothetical protein
VWSVDSSTPHHTSIFRGVEDRNKARPIDAFVVGTIFDGEMTLPFPRIEHPAHLRFLSGNGHVHAKCFRNFVAGPLRGLDAVAALSTVDLALDGFKFFRSDARHRISRRRPAPCFDYFRVEFRKFNMVAATTSQWRRFVSVPLMNGKGLLNRNGDEIGRRSIIASISFGRAVCELFLRCANICFSFNLWRNACLRL